MKGNDHKCSLSCEEFKEMVKSIRTLELALGSPIKEFQDCEQNCFNKLGKSLVAAKDLERGAIINADDLCIKVNQMI